MADRLLLESGAPDGYLLEDGTGVILMQVPAADAPDVMVRVGTTATVTSPLFTSGVSTSPTGQSVTASQGTVTLAVSSAASPGTQVATASQGTAAPVADSTVSPSGQEAVSAQGTASVATGIDVLPTGQEATTAQGSVALTVDSTVSPTGQEAVTAQGTASASAGMVVSPTGQEATSAQGTVSLTASSTVSPTGQAATASQGTATAEGGAVTSPTGQAASTAQGTVTLVVSSTIAVSGQEATAAQGTASASGEEPPPAAPTPIPYGEPIHPPHLRRQKQYQAPAPYKPAPAQVDAVVTVSGLAMQARAGTTWQVADVAIAPVGLQCYAQGAPVRATGMHNPTDEQIVEWLIQALSASV